VFINSGASLVTYLDAIYDELYLRAHMIQSFASRETELLYQGIRVARFAHIESAVQRKLQLLDSARTLKSLSVPPGNRLERLRGNRAGQYSIRINDQWRVCFLWTSAGPAEVEIVDYH
jgi:proteic killer suppression protein